MDMNSIQGMNAYTANVMSANTASARNDNTQTTDVELNNQSTATSQEAFQVNITQEALALQAEDTDNSAQEDIEQQLTQQLQQTQQTQQTQQFQGQQGSQLDIIA